MAPSNGKQINTIILITNTSRSKGNQTTRFSQLIEHNMRNIFLEKELSLKQITNKTNFFWRWQSDFKFFDGPADKLLPKFLKFFTFEKKMQKKTYWQDCDFTILQVKKDLFK